MQIESASLLLANCGLASLRSESFLDERRGRTEELVCAARLQTLPRRLKLIPRLPLNQLRQHRGLPSQRQSKPRHHGIAAEVHLRTVFVARLMVMLRGKFLRL